MRAVMVRRIGALLLGLGLLSSLGVAPVLAAGITVNDVGDATVDTGTCTLREAIIAANTDTASGGTIGECAAGSGSDAIAFSVAGTITLASGLPAITSDVTIDGAATITVDGAHAFRPFTITGGTVVMSRLAIVNGLATAEGGGIKVTAASLTVTNSTISGNAAPTGWRGGGIWQFGGTLTVTGSTISNNTAGGGAGIMSIGTSLIIDSSTISGNVAAFFAGGLNQNGGTATITDSTIAGNAAGNLGSGGFFNQADTTITNSTISNNTAGAGDGAGIDNIVTLAVTGSTISGNTTTGTGGGISNSGTMTLTDTTISGNTADGGGGGISSGGSLVVTNSTISDNAVPAGGGGGVIATAGSVSTIANATIAGNDSLLWGGGIASGGTLALTNATVSGNLSSQGGGGIIGLGVETVVNSIIAGNLTGSNPAGADVADLLETTTTSVIGVPAGKSLADVLVPAGLANNGGPTQTIALALVAGNPAIDSATGAVCAASPVNALDQRGRTRPAACDIGAYEAQPPTVAAHANVSAPATSASGAIVTYTSPIGTNEQGVAASVACLPASGSTFAVGSTTVTCTATDAVGHTGSGTFSVIVGAFPASPTLLPNTASSSGTRVMPGVFAMIALLSLLGLMLVWRAGVPSRRGMATRGSGRTRG